MEYINEYIGEMVSEQQNYINSDVTSCAKYFLIRVQMSIVQRQWQSRREHFFILCTFLKTNLNQK